ncbi:acyl-coenzyme A diphosphatase FITM2 [Aplochiton taeniatus]
MAAVDLLVNKFVELWRISFLRQKLPWIFMSISVIGSILKELELVPETYFSSTKNVLNVYFVKVSWGWTVVLLTPFLLLSNSVNRSVTFVCRRLLALFVATVIWYVCTETFFYIEDVTGSCFESASMDAMNGTFSSKVSCRHAGLHWHGFDISGHSFILAYSALVIVEEIAPMAYLMTAASTGTILNLLYLFLNAIVIMWLWMFACTSVYFHDVSHKLLGTLCGISGWYVTYRVWYSSPLSPGLPPQLQEKEHKQRA